MKITELKARKSECIKLAQSGFTFEEASEVNQLIIDNLKARIAELEGKLMQCPRCGDPITGELGDNPICGACALASELNVKTLQARIAELEKSAIIWRKYPDEKPFNSEEYLVISCGKYVIATWDSYAGRFIANDEFLDDVANWAYLPEPPEVKG